MNAPCDPADVDILDPETDTPFDPRLSDKDIAFCHLYMWNGWDATQAALSCGYPPERAVTWGLALLQRPEVSDYLMALWRAEARASGITATTLIREVRALAFSNMADFVRHEVAPDGQVTIRLREDVSREKMAAVKSMTVKETPGKYGMSRTVNVTLIDKVKPLMLLFTLLGITPKQTASGEYVAPVDQFAEYSLAELEEMAKKRGLPV